MFHVEHPTLSLDLSHAGDATGSVPQPRSQTHPPMIEIRADAGPDLAVSHVESTSIEWEPGQPQGRGHAPGGRREGSSALSLGFTWNILAERLDLVPVAGEYESLEACRTEETIMRGRRRGRNRPSPPDSPDPGNESDLGPCRYRIGDPHRDPSPSRTPGFNRAHSPRRRSAARRPVSPNPRPPPSPTGDHASAEDGSRRPSPTWPPPMPSWTTSCPPQPPRPTTPPPPDLRADLTRNG